MLIRKYAGTVFHIVSRETPTLYLCLCGARIFKNSSRQQRYAGDRYMRCLDCRRLEHERLSRCPGLKVY